MPGHLKVLLIFLVLIYIISPYDLISDFRFVIGWVDDAFLLVILTYLLRRGKKRNRSEYVYRSRPSPMDEFMEETGKNKMSGLKEPENGPDNRQDAGSRL